MKCGVKNLVQTLLLFLLLSPTAGACRDDGDGTDGDGLVFNVPRDEPSSGESILDDPTADRGGISGLCEKQQVYCNGSCLSSVGEQIGNCTMLQNNIGLAESIAVDEGSLYYTAAESEIIRMDTASMMHMGLAAGLDRPSALTVAGGRLFFGNNPLADSASEVRAVQSGVSQGTTVLTEHLGDVFTLVPAGDKLFAVAGAFGKGPLYSLPAAGGRWTRFDMPEVLHVELAGDRLYFTMKTDTEDGFYTAPIADPNRYEQIASGNPTGTPISRFFIQGEFLYWFADKATNTSRVFSRIPLAGGVRQELAVAGDGVLLAHNRTQVFYADMKTGQEGAAVMTVSLAGGDPVLLGTYEPNELQAAVADEANLYAALGYARTGAIVRYSL